ncbi:hypothetical protein NC651_027385 [Populus alba x Populus x berolinensis]|nr:hypothetical protein NC651_027385 [Populus alba x Populus x berolinensis]
MLLTAATEAVKLLLAVESVTAHCFGSPSGVMKARREEVVAVTVPTRDAGGVLVWCTRCCRGGEMVFLAGAAEESGALYYYFLCFFECVGLGFSVLSLTSPYLLEWVAFI